MSSLLVGLLRLILRPQFVQSRWSRRAKMVTGRSLCWPHLGQRIRRSVMSDVEKTIVGPEFTKNLSASELTKAPRRSKPF